MSKAKKKPTKAKDRYVRGGIVPKSVPAGMILVHNHVARTGPNHPADENGFRAWYATPEKKYVPCDCGWAPAVRKHYRVG